MQRLPDDPRELFAVFWDGQASDHEIDRAIQLNGLMSDWLSGNVETDVATDAIAELSGIDPYEYFDYVDGLLLPTGLSVYKR